MSDMPVNPLISIIVPTYNRAEMLREALQSALAQRYPHFEIIVSDNASTDQTAEVVQSFGDPRIRYFRQSHNIGITANWKFAVSQASATWITFLADDDQYLPDHLEFGVSVLRRYPTAAYHVSLAEYFGARTGIDRSVTITDSITPELFYPANRAVDFLGIDQPGLISAMMCRKTDLLDVFWGPPQYIPQDLLIMTQMMARGGFVISNHVTMRYRIHAGMTSQPANDLKSLRLNLMVWYGVRYLAQFLLDQSICTVSDIERHGLSSSSERSRH